jgi:hypothetical protein
MEQNTTDTANAPPIERRAWEAPRLISVIAVDRTRGGTGVSSAWRGRLVPALLG